MTDIFEQTILCNSCNKKMKHIVLEKAGFQLRAIQCPKCHKEITHPSDLTALKDYQDLKGKTYNVKLRVVGNSHAISIPKEIVNFMKQQENAFDNMVRLCFEDIDRLSLRFNKFDEEFF